jgi:hypothetical protein
MKLFKYTQFIKESNEDIHSICKKWGIKNYTINEEGSIDVDYDVDLTDKGLTELPLKFRNVSGDFYCDNNKLTTLKGSPISVGGVFHCSDNQLTSLLGSPISIDSDFYCSRNNITSLEGIPQMRTGNINSYGNNLRDVKGIKEGWRGRLGIISLFNSNTNDPPVYEIFKLFPRERWDEVVEFLNEYDVIRDGEIVVLQALEMVFHEMGLDVPEIEYIKGYEVI